MAAERKKKPRLLAEDFDYMARFANEREISDLATSYKSSGGSSSSLQLSYSRIIARRLVTRVRICLHKHFIHASKALLFRV